MTTKVILYFPSDATDKAVTYDLVKRYDLRINILRASWDTSSAVRTTALP